MIRDPEITILVPALNKEITIAQFLDWCQAGISASGAVVEILIVDSSIDSMAEISVAKGARVLKGAETRSRPRLHRCDPIHPRPLRDYGRC